MRYHWIKPFLVLFISSRKRVNYGHACTVENEKLLYNSQASNPALLAFLTLHLKPFGRWFSWSKMHFLARCLKGGILQILWPFSVDCWRDVLEPLVVFHENVLRAQPPYLCCAQKTSKTKSTESARYVMTWRASWSLEGHGWLTWGHLQRSLRRENGRTSLSQSDTKIDGKRCMYIKAVKNVNGGRVRWKLRSGHGVF